MTQAIRLLVFLFLLSILVACSSPGTEYIGKWQNIKDSKDRIEIVKNGESFLVITRKKDFKGKEEEIKRTATLKDNMLQVQIMYVTIPISYVKASDTLLWSDVFSSAEYRREK